MKRRCVTTQTTDFTAESRNIKVPLRKVSPFPSQSVEPPGGLKQPLNWSDLAPALLKTQTGGVGVGSVQLCVNEEE
ncbi:hypothetical protein AMEX_G5848 [Astyanax mexicanus]|uniref:Uncharacterized protein n=1 Tax=Astyanax mexicanus TaxID=7994 RepID=A0A8T2M8H5_ASTMX|nr:hypothetical protein AMEX_G5848 [Astyanax mexicanus]